MKRSLSLTVVVAIASLTVVAAVAPGPPHSLAANVSGSVVTLTWLPPATGGVPAEYVVEGSLSPGGAVIASFGVPTTAVTVSDVPDGVYYVRVRAQNADGTSAASNEAIVVVPGVGGGCTSPPNAPSNLNSTVSGNSVTLVWAAPIGGCPATAYVVQAGFATGLSDVAVINVGPATSLSASAPPGTYYVRVVALNAYGGSVTSVEIILNVGITNRVTIGFDGLVSVVNGSPITTYTESGFTITTTAQSWVALTSYGNPAPFIQFTREAAQPALVGEVAVTSSGPPFRFESVDVYSSVTPIPYEILGLRNGAAVLTLTGTVPNTFGAFATINSPQPGEIVDTLLIRLTNPATPCCANPVGFDNIVVVR